MSSFNKVIMMGNLTRDPELKYLPSGMAVCELAIAVNRSWTPKGGEKKEEVSFFDCVAWGKTGEVIAEHMKKGRPILFEGSLRQERWETATGEKRSRVKINIDRFSFVGGKRDDASYGGPPPAEPDGVATVNDDSVDDIAF